MRAITLSVVPVLTLLAATGHLTLQTRAGDESKRVAFPSADGKTMLVGYIFAPLNPTTTRAPAIVMMHGRAGAYSLAANGVFDASTLSKRHQAWGRLWAENGYVAILVDGFGPRGYPAGFGRGSYDFRPEELNEVTVRPLDAYGALAYLRTRPDIIPDRVGLQGWSNGGSAALAAMAVGAPGISKPSPSSGFRAALVFYPGCKLKSHFAEEGFLPYAPVRVFHGSDDEEVSAIRCAKLVERSRSLGGDIEMTLYDGATHDFDDPGRRRQGVDANAKAFADVVPKALSFFAALLKPSPAP